jgi:hypothetical protein
MFPIAAIPAEITTPKPDKSLIINCRTLKALKSLDFLDHD